MSVLSGKKILLGISGSIAAYKTPFIVRILKSFEADVRVIMTPAAKEFVSRRLQRWGQSRFQGAQSPLDRHGIARREDPDG